MARVTGALFSMDASGQIGKALVFSKWKGRAYCREYVVPENPETANQMNVREAFTLLIVSYQGEAAPYKLEWETYAKPFAMSGFNKYVGRGMDQYVDQIGTATQPVSVSVTGTPPAETFVWA
jgi:hypothetical protein